MVFDFEKMEVYQISLEVIDKSVLTINKLPRGSSNLHFLKDINGLRYYQNATARHRRHAKDCTDLPNH